MLNKLAGDVLRKQIQEVLHTSWKDVKEMVLGKRIGRIRGRALLKNALKRRPRECSEVRLTGVDKQYIPSQLSLMLILLQCSLNYLRFI